MTSRWSRRRKLRKMVEAAESDILRHFKEMVAEKHKQNGNAQVEVKRPQVAEESGVSHCCHPGIDSQVFTSRYEQISEVCETYESPDKDNDCDFSFDSFGCHAPPFDSDNSDAEADDDAPNTEFLITSLRYWASTFSVSLVGF